jgi:hypothetical protein
MNNAGLPGTGLGGLFYILLALWMPVAELRVSLRGGSSRERWRQVGTQFALACGIVAAVGTSVAASMHLVGGADVFGMSGPTLVVAPVLLAVVLLSGLVLVLRTWAALIQDPPVAATRARTGALSSAPEDPRGSDAESPLETDGSGSPRTSSPVA